MTKQPDKQDKNQPKGGQAQKEQKQASHKENPKNNQKLGKQKNRETKGGKCP